MSAALNLSVIRDAVGLIEAVSVDGQLLALKNLAQNNGGRWDLPSVWPGPDGQPFYSPLLSSIEVAGVYAMAEAVEELPQNWLRAARNILNAAETAT
ncbi:hypothetical protein TRP8649_01366 [Pelagimonas phthalicica]|uniref:Uncharacterized protein n=1 Tax=Pelagimonas phthalicica TaxID=1037362 RepID=A0A238JA80_9RHOB|nr:hypothetical protein [Pelagimonas phthalicica]TDS94212.1 hypothetical protein CLV87_0706 [Pelagimonas phthalicica]SMX27263.1 hypothetical protein TRP8649_01366 [Pelagimonas phthalicica]